MTQELIKILLVFAMTFSQLSAQVNLVPNGGFEDTVICSSIMANQFVAADWWTYNTSDYYNKFNLSCPSGGGGGKNVPNNFAGFQNPNSGKAYAGLVAYSATFPNAREWLQIKLTDTLETGKNYCISFRYNQANEVRYSTDKLGMFFSINGINLTAPSFVQYNAQVYTPVGVFLNDTLSWNKYYTPYLSAGNEVYIAIGNFFDDTNTNKQLSYPSNTSPFADAYYLLDDISIIPSDLPAWAGKDTSMCEGDSVYIGRPYEVGLDNIWKEITTGTQVGAGAGFWLKADSSATYVVTQDLCGTITTDTIKVIVNCIGVKEFGKSAHLKVFPSPVNDILKIESKLAGAEMVVYDILGKTMLTKNLNYEAAIRVSDLPDGIYFLRIGNSQGSITMKIIVQH